MKAVELRDLGETDLRETSRRCGASSSGCGSSTQPASLRTRRVWRSVKRDLARALTVAQSAASTARMTMEEKS